MSIEDIHKRVDSLTLDAEVRKPKHKFARRTKIIGVLLVCFGLVATVGISNWIVSHNVWVSGDTVSISWIFEDVLASETQDEQSLGTISASVVANNLTIQLSGMYPNYEGNIVFNITNTGDIDLEFGTFAFPTPYDTWFTVSDNITGLILNNGQHVQRTFYLVVPDTAEPNQLINFEIVLDATQYDG